MGEVLKNNNGAVLTRMAKRSLFSNRRRNGIMIFAIMLSAFLLFTIFTVGLTWVHMQKLQNIRIQGGDFDAILYGGFTREQLEICKADQDITMVGVEGVGGWAESTDRDSTLHTIFVWEDETRWEQMTEPAREWTKGSYPKEDNEIMVTKAALKDCGYEELEIGDSLELTYSDQNGSHTKKFTISGMWGGYRDEKVFYVTKSFFEQSGFSFEEYGRGFLYLKFKPLMAEEKIHQMEEKMNLKKDQALVPTLMAYAEGSLQLLGGMGGLAVVTCFCAYLLIYNIMYLSVSGNIRYYGLLQTVGMTGKQIYRLVFRQMLLVGTIGTGSGLLLGTAVSFFLIPGVVKTLGIRGEEIQIVFHPLIFLVSILLVGVTIYLGSRKPVRIAAQISPVEAIRYRRYSGKRTTHKSGKGSVLRRMAKEQLSKDRKKTAVVVLSLGASLSVFLCLVTLIESQGARTIVSNYMEADIVLNNDTMTMEKQDKWKPLMDSEFLEQIHAGPGVREMHPMYNAQIVIPWEPGFPDTWMREFYETWMEEDYEDIIDMYKQHPENFHSYLTGITEAEFEYLNSTLETPVDKSEFLAGKSCIIYRNGMALAENEIIGNTVDFALFDEQDTLFSIQIAGSTDDVYYADMIAAPPTLIVSDAFLKSLVKEPYVSKVSIFYETEYDEETESMIKTRIAESTYKKDFSYESKLDEMKSVKKSQGNMMGIGIGITLILALIGIMNYVNTVLGNIQSRQVEIAVLESVGMTEKQVRTLLVLEGLLYGALSLFVTGTIGLGVTYCLYQSMNYRGAAFGIPILPVLLMTVFILAVCVLIPLLSHRVTAGKGTVVERLRGLE